MNRFLSVPASYVLSKIGIEFHNFSTEHCHCQSRKNRALLYVRIKVMVDPGSWKKNNNNKIQKDKQYYSLYMKNKIS